MATELDHDIVIVGAGVCGRLGLLSGSFGLLSSLRRGGSLRGRGLGLLSGLRGGGSDGSDRTASVLCGGIAPNSAVVAAMRRATVWRRWCWGGLMGFDAKFAEGRALSEASS